MGIRKWGASQDRSSDCNDAWLGLRGRFTTPNRWNDRQAPLMALRAIRKMCAVIPHHLGKGGPLRASRCIPPGSWHAIGIEPCRTNEPYRRFITRGEISVLPAEGTPSAPIDMKGVPPPLMSPTRQTWSLPAPPAPDHGGTSAVPSRSSEPPSSPRPHGQPSAGWMPPAILLLDHARRI